MSPIIGGESGLAKFLGKAPGGHVHEPQVGKEEHANDYGPHGQPQWLNRLRHDCGNDDRHRWYEQ